MKKQIAFTLLAGLVLLYALPSSSALNEAVGRVSELSGEVKVKRAETKITEDLSAKSRLFQNDKIITTDDGKLKVLFFDDSVMAIGPNTEIKIIEFIYKPKEKMHKTGFSLFKGRVLTFVGKLFRNSKSRFEIKTPTAVAGVRGTYFSVSVEPIDATEKPESKPADAPDAGTPSDDGAAEKPKAGSGGDDVPEAAPEAAPKILYRTIVRVHEGVVNVRTLAAETAANIDVAAGKEIYITRELIGDAKDMSKATIKKDLSLTSVNKLKRSKGAKDTYKLTNPNMQKMNKFLGGEGGGKERRAGGGDKDRRPPPGGGLMDDVAGRAGDDAADSRRRMPEPDINSEDAARRNAPLGKVNVDVEIIPPKEIGN